MFVFIPFTAAAVKAFTTGVGLAITVHNNTKDK